MRTFEDQSSIKCKMNQKYWFRAREICFAALAFLALAVLAIVMAVLGQGCSSLPSGDPNLPQPAPSVSPSPSASPSPADTSARPLKGWPDAYSDFIKANVSPAMIAYEPTSVCPLQAQVDHKKFWAEFLKAVALPESGWDRTNQYVETGLDIDPVTGVQTKSEGLMQLSYQDRLNYPKATTCQKLDWGTDKSKALADRSITDPYINLGCALEIMDRLLILHPHDLMLDALGNYWSTAEHRSSKMLAQLKTGMPECFNAPQGSGPSGNIPEPSPRPLPSASPSPARVDINSGQTLKADIFQSGWDCGPFRVGVIVAKNARVHAVRSRPNSGFAVNGGIYDGTPPNSHAHGMLFSDGQQIAPFVDGKGESYFSQGPDGKYRVGHAPVPLGSPFLIQTSMPLYGVHDFDSQIERSERTGLCVQADNTLLMITTHSIITIAEFEQAIRPSGACKTECVQAVNLDGGPSTQMLVGGKLIDGTERRVDYWVTVGP